MDKIRITASLDTWERTLLEDFKNCFLQDNLDGPKTSNHNTTHFNDDVTQKTFERWGWAIKLGDDISGVISNTPAALLRDPEHVWGLVCRWISRNEAGYACYSRLSRLQDDNQNLEQQFRNANFGGDASKGTSIVPHGNDRPLWHIVSRIMHCLPLEWRGLRLGEELDHRFGRCYILANREFDPDADITDLAAFKAEEISAQLGTPSNIGATSPPGVGTSTRATAPLTVQSESGSNDDDVEDLEEQWDLLPQLFPSIPYDHGPQISQSSVDKSLLLHNLKSKLKTDAEAPTSDAALERLLSILVNTTWPAQPPSDDETDADENSVSEHGTPTTEGYREFEIWSLTKMASIERRRQLRKSPLAADNSELLYLFKVAG